MNIKVCFVKLEVPINMQVTDDMMFSEVAFKYFAKAGIDQVKDQPKFLFNSREIKPDNYKSLKELDIRNMTRINVVLGRDIIGA